MIKTYCDRCNKEIEDNFVGFYEKANKRNIGDFIPNIVKVINDSDLKNHDYTGIDLCETCEKELAEIVTNFMKSK